MPATPELVTFVTMQLQNGFSADDIAAQLSVDGWEAEDIQDAFTSAQTPQVSASITGIPVRVVLTDAVTVFFHRLWVILIISVLLAGFFAAYYFIPVYAMQFFITAFKEANPWKDVVITASGASFLLFLTSVLQGWGPMAIMYAVLHRHTRAHPFQALWKTFGKLTRYVTFWVLQLMICSGVVFSLIIPFLFISAHFGVKVQKARLVFTQSNIAVGIGLSCVALLSIICLILWFSLTVPILVDERIKPLNAMLKSRAYFSKQFLPVTKLLLPKLILQCLLLLLPLLLFIKTPNKNVQLGVITGVFFLLFVFHEVYTGMIYDFVKGTRFLGDHKPHVGGKLLFILLALLGVILPFLTALIIYKVFNSLLFALLSSNPIK